MRIFFAGTPIFSAVILQALMDAGHQIVGVFTQPDRPAGRGLQLQPSPVKTQALNHQLPFWQPPSLSLHGKFMHDAKIAHEALAQATPDLLIVVAYGLILPQSLLDIVPALNIHTSLLPRWRGAAPIQRAIEAGDVKTGVALMKMEAGLDTGAVWQQDDLAIAPDDTAATLHDKLACLAAASLLHFLPNLASAVALNQADEGLTYAKKISKAEAQLDFSLLPARLERKIRAFNPMPGAFFVHRGQVIKVWQACCDQSAHGVGAGTILGCQEGVLWIACGTAGVGRLGVLNLQRAGGKPLGTVEFLRGYCLENGERVDPLPLF